MKRVPPILYPWALILSHWIACIVPWACFPLISPPFYILSKKKVSTWNLKHLKLDFSSSSLLLLLFFPCRRIKQLPKSRETKGAKMIGRYFNLSNWSPGAGGIVYNHYNRMMYDATLLRESLWSRWVAKYYYIMLMIVFVSYFKTLLYNIKIWIALCDQKLPLLNIGTFTWIIDFRGVLLSAIQK